MPESSKQKSGEGDARSADGVSSYYDMVVEKMP
jgi:hypothetical protein